MKYLWAPEIKVAAFRDKVIKAMYKLKDIYAYLQEA
jgi:hypothetical protein